MGGLGLALGGGGITGCSHVGVICALEEEKIPISYISGTSAGGMVAAMYAAGYSGQQLARMVPEMTRKILDYDYSGMLLRILLHKRPLPGLFRGKRLQRYLERALGDKTLRDLELPLSITACDLQSTRQVLFTSAPLQSHYLGGDVEIIAEVKVVDALLGTMAIPGLFRPIRMGSRMLVDGGLVDNCPTASLKAMGANRVLAVNLATVEPIPPVDWSFSMIVTRSLSLGLSRLSLSDSGFADLVLQPPVGEFGMLDFSCISKCLERGYEHTRQRMDDIYRLLETPAKAVEGDFHP